MAVLTGLAGRESGFPDGERLFPDVDMGLEMRLFGRVRAETQQSSIPQPRIGGPIRTGEERIHRPK